jgi:hypothetical protein
MASGSKSGMTAGLWLAGAVSLLALPSAVLAFATDFETQFGGPAAEGALQAIDSAGTPPRLARAIPIRSLAKGPLYPFTRCVLHYLAQGEIRFGDLGDSAVVLAQVISDASLINQVIHPHECDWLANLDQTTHHGNGIQGVCLQWLFAPAQFGFDQCSIGRRLIGLTFQRLCQLLIAKRLN